MQWIKAHLNVVAAGTVSLLALVALILGVLLPDVAQPLKQDVGLLSLLQNPKAANRNGLETLRNEEVGNHEKLGQMLSTVAKIGDHEPLPVASKVFPAIKSGSEDAPFQFKREFLKAQQALIAMLKADGPPTDAEIATARDEIIRRVAQQDAEKDDGKKDAKPAKGPAALPNVLQPGMVRPGGGTFGQLPVLGPNATPEERVRDSPEARASVNKARQIWCYAMVANLDQRPAITDPTVQRPRPEDMWYAQVSLWVQQDILKALNQANLNRAKELPDKKPWVGNLPFKRLASFNIGGFVPKVDAQGPARGVSGNADGLSGPPPMDGSAVLSKRGCLPDTDVIQFTIEIYIEAKALPEIIDQICSSGFYTVLQVGYEVEPPNLELVGYIYGSQPVIKTWLLLEGSFLRTNKDYEKLIPESVKEDVKSGKAVGAGGGQSASPAGNTPMRSGMREGRRLRGMDEVAP